jgi:hypothetical protein
MRCLIFLFARYYYGDQLKKVEMGGSYNTYRRVGKRTQEIIGKSEGKRAHRRL